MFRRMIEKLDQMFHSDNNLRVREDRRRASRRFSPSLTVAGLETRLSLSSVGLTDISITVTNEDPPPTNPTGTPDSSDQGTTPTPTNEDFPLAYLTGTAKYPTY